MRKIPASPVSVPDGSPSALALARTDLARRVGWKALLPVLLAVAGGGVVQAQGIVRPPAAVAAPAVAAPALPGLAARPAPAPIPRTSSESLGPNAALFDAIARGDLGAAREAVARGANLDARNALGLSPLDTAVDQGRNDIAFYLLSARDGNRGFLSPPGGGSGDAAPGGNASAGLGAPPPSAASRAPRRAAARRPAEPAGPVLAAAPRGPQLFAGNGGAPMPSIGFLGFDAGRPAGVAPPEAAAPAARRSRR